MKLLKSIWHDIQEIKSTKKELREFGIVIGIFFLLIAGLLAWKGKSYLFWVVLAAPFLAFAFINPFLLKPFQKVWMGLAVTIGWFMSRLILSVVFFLVLTPLSLVLRLTGKKFLDLDFKTGDATYWNFKSAEELPKERYEKQY
jgi:hypothetical protein